MSNHDSDNDAELDDYLPMFGGSDSDAGASSEQGLHLPEVRGGAAPHAPPGGEQRGSRALPPAPFASP